jgi:hypothetical protein
MTRFDNERTKEDIRGIVHNLFRSENYPGDREAADNILADDYIPITRAKGQTDSDREDTLKKIANASASRHRDVDRAEINVALFQDDSVAIVKSRLPVTNSEHNPPVVEHYLNMHVFLKRNNQWKCVAWQVTKVDESIGGK